MATYTAWLRGINVGGNNKLPMKDLKAIFEQEGCTEVVSYIQSGNVVFDATAAEAKTLGARVAARIEKDLDIKSPVIVRSAAAIKKVAAAHPMGDAAAEPKFFAVGFLQAKPSAAQVKAMEVDRFLPDGWKVVGSEVYLHYPNGMARTKLTNAYLDRALGTVSTVRNWNTLTKIAALCLERA